MPLLFDYMRTMASRYVDSPYAWSADLGGDPVPPKLFLAPAKDGGAPPDVDGTVGAAAPSAASPSTLAGGRRMSAGKGGPREGGLHSKCSREALCGGTL